MSEYTIVIHTAGKKLLRKFDTVTAAMEDWQKIGTTRKVPGTQEHVTGATLDLGDGRGSKLPEQPAACLSVP